MNRYYFKIIGDEIDMDCTEKCMVINGETMIGSVACQECKHCIESDATIYGCTWIVCERIKEATQLSKQKPTINQEEKQ